MAVRVTKGDTKRILAFELSVNGGAVRRVGVGEFGILDAKVRMARLKYENGGVREVLYLQTVGQEGHSGASLLWNDVQLAAGDTVTIRVVDGSNLVVDAPDRQLDPRLNNI